MIDRDGMGWDGIGDAGCDGSGRLWCLLACLLACTQIYGRTGEPDRIVSL